MRWALYCALSAAVGCAAQSKSALKAACEKDPAHDARCINELTTVEYESREEVMRREEARKENAESDRLSRMRREEEERQARRGTVSSTVAEEELAPEDAAALAGSAKTVEEEDNTGSSVRALQATHVDQKAGPPPTPEDYLRGSQCLLSEDVARTTAVFNAAKKNGSAGAGAMAMSIVDGNQLLSQVKAEITHRGLALSGNGICAADQTRRVVELLRELVGPTITKEADTEPYARGLARLRRELEVRAGLPKSE